MFENCFDRLRQRSALVHNITNYVTVNDVANIILACGASPIMADEPEEAAEITAICTGLNINIGTLNQRRTWMTASPLLNPSPLPAAASSQSPVPLTLSATATVAT